MLQTCAQTPAVEHIAHALTVALGARDHYTRIHSDRVVKLAVETGKQLGLNPHELQQLGLGARFHDLGKIGIPDHILHKTTPFDSDEWSFMQQHVLIGEQIVLAINGGRNCEVARIVRHHHENFDGSGYPDGLAGESIPVMARIITVVDSYDAMVAQRPYHKGPRSHAEIMDILNSEATQKHDPYILNAFSTMIATSALRAPDGEAT